MWSVVWDARLGLPLRNRTLSVLEQLVVVPFTAVICAGVGGWVYAINGKTFSAPGQPMTSVSSLIAIAARLTKW
jgi:hypothetical protein